MELSGTKEPSVGWVPRFPTFRGDTWTCGIVLAIDIPDTLNSIHIRSITTWPVGSGYQYYSHLLLIILTVFCALHLCTAGQANIVAVGRAGSAGRKTTSAFEGGCCGFRLTGSC